MDIFLPCFSIRERSSVINSKQRVDVKGINSYNNFSRCGHIKNLNGIKYVMCVKSPKR